MGNIEVYKSSVVQVKRPAAPPPPPPKPLNAYSASSVAAYVPGSTPTRTAAPEPASADNGPKAFASVDLANPTAQVRGTQPLVLPKDWMDGLPPTTNSTPNIETSGTPAAGNSLLTTLVDSLSHGQAGDLLSLMGAKDAFIPDYAMAAVKTMLSTTGLPNLPDDAVNVLARAVLTGKLTLPNLDPNAGQDRTSAFAQFGQQYAALSATEPALKAIEDRPDVRAALLALAVGASQSIAGSSATVVGGAGAGIPAYAPYQLSQDKVDSLLNPDIKTDLPSGTSQFDILHDLIQVYRTPAPDSKPLSADQTKALWDFYGTATVNASPEAAEAVAKNLSTLLWKNRLTTSDMFGKSTLDYFETFTKAPKAWQFGNTSKAEIARQILQTMARPDGISQGNGTMDCAEATIESQLAVTKPADFARVAVGLATHGAAAVPGADLQGHDHLMLPQLNPANQAGRGMLDFAMQTALAQYAGAPVGQGLSASQAEHVQDAILGGDYVTMSKEDTIKYAMAMLSLPDLDQRVQNNISTFGDLLKVTMNVDGALHSMAVVQMRMDGVSTWDPATNKVYKIPMDTFIHDLVRLSGPRSWLLNDFQAAGVTNTDAEGGLKAGSTTKKG